MGETGSLNVHFTFTLVLPFADLKCISLYFDEFFIFGRMISGWVPAMCWLQLIAGMPLMQKSESGLIVHSFTGACGEFQI